MDAQVESSREVAVVDVGLYLIIGWLCLLEIFDLEDEKWI